MVFNNNYNIVKMVFNNNDNIVRMVFNNNEIVRIVFSIASAC